MTAPTMTVRELAACARLWATLLDRQRRGYPTPRTLAGACPRGRTALPPVSMVDGRARLRLNAPIGDDGTGAREFVAALDAITARHIDLHVDSPGGSVFDAFAMHLALRQHPARVTVHVEREAFSAASIVAMAGDEIRIAPGARMQVHELVPSRRAIVTREYRAVLDDLGDRIAQLYAHRTGVSAATWRARMRTGNGAGTWFSAREAVAVGLADVLADDRRPPTVSARHALSPRPIAGLVRRLALV